MIDEKTLKDDLGIADETERDAIMKKVKENKHVKGKRIQDKITIKVLFL